MVRLRRLGAFFVSLTLAFGLLIIPSRVWAEEGFRTIAVRAQGFWLNYDDKSVLVAFEGGFSRRVDFSPAAGIEVGAEVRPWRLLGVELGMASAPFDANTTDTFSHNGFIPERGRARHRFNPLSAGLDFHVPSGDKLDVYFGPTYSRVYYGPEHRQGLGEDLVHGNALGFSMGVDVSPRTGPWAFTASVKWFRAPLSGDLVDIHTYVDVFLIGAGVGWRH